MLQGAVARSRMMLAAGAYMHWYAAYGVDGVEFEEAYGVIETVISAYCDYGVM